MKILAVVWQSYYNAILKASKSIKDFKVKVYSSRVLDSEPDKLEKALKEIEESDILFFYRSNEAVWEEIEKKVKNTHSKTVFLGHDPSYFMLSNVKPEILNKAYRYLVINGEKNIINMFRFLAKEISGINLNYDEPEEIPWEGIYHPKAERIFRSIDDYLNWYRDYKENLTSSTVGILFSRYYWINGNTEVEDLLIEELETKGFNVIPVFAYSVKDTQLGTKSTQEVIEEHFIDENGNLRVDLLIKLISFFIGTTRQKEIHNTEVASEGVEILKKLNIPVICPVSSYYKTIEEWEKEELSLDIGWSVALPEFEGVIEPIIVSAQKQSEENERKKIPIKNRIKKLINRIEMWIELKRTPPQQRRVAFILHNNPCASVEATVGLGAHLDTLESVVEIMKRMKEEGYKIQPPQNGKELIDEIMNKKAISEFRWTTVEEIVQKGGAIAFIDKDKYLDWFNELSEKTKQRMVSAWGEPPGEHKDGVPPAMVYDGKIVITGLRYENTVVCVQPKRGCSGARCDGQVCKILHDPSIPPTHQYIATYRWLSREFKAHAVVHVGTHGNLEFLPGKAVALSSSCFPDIGIDTMPHLYIYNADNPSEGTIAKRRSYAVLVDHMQTVLTESGLYEELLELDRALFEYEEAKKRKPWKLHILEHTIMDALKKANLDKEIKILWNGKKVLLSELTHEELHEIPFEKVLDELHGKISLIRNTQIQDGMHIFGRLPKGERRIDFIYSILRYDSEVSLRKKISKLLGYDLNSLLSEPQKIDPLTGKSFGSILHEIDKLGKEVIKMVLSKEA